MTGQDKEYTVSSTECESEGLVQTLASSVSAEKTFNHPPSSSIGTNKITSDPFQFGYYAVQAITSWKQ